MEHAKVTMEKPETRGRKKLHHLEIHPAKNGGHMVMHHFASDNGYQEPATHVFGPEQGEEMMDHVAKHAKVKMPETMAEEKMEEKIDPGIHKKVAEMEEDE